MFEATEQYQTAFLCIAGIFLAYIFKYTYTLYRKKVHGNRLPGPEESLLWGNAADMQAQGGLVLFLDHLHERCFDVIA